MKIPEICIPWINLQRSGYKKPVEEFRQNIKREYLVMSGFLPEECKTILDIGCGLGGIDVLLANRYRDPTIYLYDKNTKSEKVVYGFNRGESFYNSFEATESVMKENCVKYYKILDAEEGPPDVGYMDLVISLLSWGYHYKVEEYIDEVYRIMKPGSRLIMDIREYSDGINVLKKKDFKAIYKIEYNNKAYRVCCIK